VSRTRSRRCSSTPVRAAKAAGYVVVGVPAIGAPSIRPARTRIQTAGAKELTRGGRYSRSSAPTPHVLLGAGDGGRTVHTSPTALSNYLCVGVVWQRTGTDNGVLTLTFRGGRVDCLPLRGRPHLDDTGVPGFQLPESRSRNGINGRVATRSAVRRSVTDGPFG